MKIGMLIGLMVGLSLAPSAQAALELQLTTRLPEQLPYLYPDPRLVLINASSDGLSLSHGTSEDLCREYCATEQVQSDDLLHCRQWQVEKGTLG